MTTLYRLYSQLATRNLQLAPLLIAAFLLRSLRLAWQPLWWDEGYSIYFASEPLKRMFALTAQDIHPPFYYALLHLWLTVVQSLNPTALRLLSVIIGVLGIMLMHHLARTLYPQRGRVVWLATLLLVVNPLHLFYSQELRMYGLAMMLGVAATAAFWRMVMQWDQNHALGQLPSQSAWRTGIIYLLLATLGLYSLYYFALLLLAHAAWSGWHFRRRRPALRRLLWTYLGVTLLYLPWLIYALPKLVVYVAAKVPADADQPLNIVTYISRHLLAFTSGHLAAPAAAQEAVRWFAVVALIALLLTTRIHFSATRRSWPAARLTPAGLLWSCLLIPTGLAFLLNVRLPFFPTGGERLLLFVLPYLLLLAAEASDRAWRFYGLGALALALLLASALGGIWTYFSTPRYTDHDYRALIGQIVQQSTTDDAVLAIFPWEVGYWRAYAATAACRVESAACTLTHGIEAVDGPSLRLVDDKTLTWGPAVTQVIDDALAQGALWFPAPLSFGSTLPGEIEAYLAAHATNVENRWVTSTTRLSAWRTLPRPPLTTRADDFARVQLQAAGVIPAAAASANQVIAVALNWRDPNGPELDANLGATVRIVDAADNTWASRQYFPLGSLGQHAADGSALDEVGLIIPVGLPPGEYDVRVGVVVSATQALLAPVDVPDGQHSLATIGSITITTPSAPQPVYRLPIQQALRPTIAADGVGILGFTLGDSSAANHLAGEALDVTIFMQNQQPNPTARELFLQLSNHAGEAVASWQGQSPAGWPSTDWPTGALIQAPVTFFTPPTIATGDYTLVAGHYDPATDHYGAPIALSEVAIVQRSAQFVAPTIPVELDEPVQFGAHIQLLGYAQQRQGDKLQLSLYWQVLQTLLPPHHIFVHLDNRDEITLSQADGPPLTATGRAPSGSWLPDEYLVTEHTLILPALGEESHLTIGLYAPQSGTRLPATVNGAAAGDSARLPLAVPTN